MQGGMMEMPLTVPDLVTRRAERLFAHRPVLSRTASETQRSTWGEVAGRARRLAGALRKLGIRSGDRVATFAWNTHRHLEAQLAIPSMGAVLHPLNVRLAPEQVAYIIEHADDVLVLCESSLLDSWRAVEPHLDRPRQLVVMPDGEDSPVEDERLDYENLLANSEPVDSWSEPEQSAAAHMSYTTGTTGNPKGVVFSHRSSVLTSFCCGLVDADGLSSTDTLCLALPMFLSQVHQPFAAAMHGSGLLLPGSDLSPAGVCDLIAAERPTVVNGFCTLLPGILDHWRNTGADLSSLRRIVCGGSPVPRKVSRAFEEEVGVPVVHAWAMSETSGHGSFTYLPSEAGNDLSEESRSYYMTSQGRPPAMVEMRLLDDGGGEVVWDGESTGELQVRGPWVARKYFREGASSESFAEGWLRTGDAACIDELGYLRIADRMKDLVKSGGEWIPSLALEEHLMAHPAVAETAVVAVPDEELGERPLACVVLRPDACASTAEEQLVEHLRSRVGPSWLPETFVFEPELPKTSIGKIDKKVLRARFDRT